MNPLLVCLWIFAAVCASTWALSLITRENSWVDRLWSITPIAYVWVFAAASVEQQGAIDGRVLVMAVLVTLWGVRLTANYARKGGYAPGGEDYRWPILRERMPRWQFELFNLLFITVYQNVIILLMTLPIATAYLNPSPLGVWDVVLTVVYVLALVGESAADQQQWNFHRAKAAAVASGREPRERFLRSGLFAWSRHPNFFFEQTLWWLFYGFAIAATGVWLHWTVAGAVLLTVLFVGSTIFTESITRSRYPEYADYQRTTSPIIPLPRWATRRAKSLGVDTPLR